MTQGDSAVAVSQDTVHLIQELDDVLKVGKKAIVHRAVISLYDEILGA